MKKVRAVGAIVLMSALLFTGVDYAAAAAAPADWHSTLDWSTPAYLYVVG
jgi:hypothetical protein